MKNFIKFLIIIFTFLKSYTLAQTSFIDSKAVNPSTLPYKYISSKHITASNSISSRTAIANKLKEHGGHIYNKLDTNKNGIPLVGTTYEFITENSERALLTITKINPGFEVDELDENKIIRTNTFTELVEFYQAVFDPDLLSSLRYINTDSIQSAYFVCSLSSENYIQYMVLITDPAFSKDVYLGTVYFKRNSSLENKEGNIREFLESIRYGNTASTTSIEEGVNGVNNET